METIGCQFWRFVKGGGGYRKTPVFRQRRAQTETPFAAEFHDSRAAAFLLCPLMRQNGPFVPLAVLSVGVAACASPPAQLTRSDRSGGYRPGPGGKLYRVYPPQSVEARIILIAARVDLRPLIEQSERGGMAPAAGSI